MESRIFEDSICYRVVASEARVLVFSLSSRLRTSEVAIRLGSLKRLILGYLSGFFSAWAECFLVDFPGVKMPLS